MKIFYSGSARLSDVDCYAPLERSVHEALMVLAGIHEGGAFMGICLDER
jgi:hypothetical protein